jgi:hypothetical protein
MYRRGFNRDIGTQSIAQVTRRDDEQASGESGFCLVSRLALARSLRREVLPGLSTSNKNTEDGTASDGIALAKWILISG